jgi:hypothetical protein
MTTCVVNYYDEPDQRELVEIDYQCSVLCMKETLEREANVSGFDVAGELNLPDGGSVDWGTCPGGAETQEDVHCSACGDLLWQGLSTTNA